MSTRRLTPEQLTPRKTEMHCRFSFDTTRRIYEISEALDERLNYVVSLLVDTILPYVQIEEVCEPHKVVQITLPYAEQRQEPRKPSQRKVVIRKPDYYDDDEYEGRHGYEEYGR